MNKIKQFCGIDISKDVFDVVDHEENHYQFKNDTSGFKEFGKILTESSHCVMEVTGWNNTKELLNPFPYPFNFD